MNTASNTLLQLTTQVGQAHVATGVPLDLGTNTQPSDPRTQRNTKPRVYRPTPVRPVPAGENEQLSLSGSTPVRSVRHTDQTDPSLKAPKAPNRTTDHQTDPNSKQQQHKTTADTPRHSPQAKTHRGFHRSDRSRAPVRPV
jgi:hypothetical protein